MADEKKPVEKAKGVQGVDFPFEANQQPAEGVDPETMLFEGIAPDTHERLTVTLAGLKAEFGENLGEKKYVQIAGVGGGSQFFNPHLEASTYRPPLGIIDLKG